MNQSTDPVTLLVDGIDRLQRELAAAHDENAKRGSEILDLQQENAELRKWKDAVEEAAVVNWTLNSENADNPTKAIQDLIACILQEALDPMCSKPAAELHERIQVLEKENTELRQDAERLKYVEKNHVRAHSPHMDGTFGWSFRGLVNGRFRTFREAIDAAMKEAK